MLTQVDVKLPPCWGPLLDWSGACFAVRHAALAVRQYEVVAALAVRDVMAYHDVLVVAPHGRQREMRRLIRRATAAAKTSTESSGPALWYLRTQSGREIAVADDEAASAVTATRAYVVDAQELTDVRGLAAETCLLGEMPRRGHWFLGVEPTMQLDAPAVLASFPRLGPLNEDDPQYERDMLLRDVVPPRDAFEDFAAERLRVRTDRPLQRLDERQRNEVSPDAYGTPIVSLYLSKLQRRYVELKARAVEAGRKPWFILLKYRRGGFTTLEQALSYWSCATRPRSYAATLAHTRESTRRIFRITELFRERDPRRATTVDNDSRTEVEFSNGSYFFIGTAGGQGFSRGDTLQRVHGSEVSRWLQTRNARVEAVDDLVAALLGAASQGEVVLESTPYGREWFYHAYRGAVDGTNDFTPIFLRWYDDPLNVAQDGSFSEEEVQDTLATDEEALVERHGLSFAQLAFRRDARRMYGRLFAQEMPEDDESCFISSGVCFFDVDVLLRLMERVPETAGAHVPGGIEHTWEEPVRGARYVLGVDTSEGLSGSDPNGLGVLRRDTGEQVASVHGLFSPRRLAEHVARVARKYNDAQVWVEKQNHGHAVLQKLRDLGYGDRTEAWDTNAATRPVMLDELAEAVEEGYMVIRDHAFLGECAAFKLQANGKYEADSGAHDDRVVKWSIAWQGRKARENKVVSRSLY